MDDLITIGKILKPFGVHGEVRIQSLTDVPGRLEKLKEVILVTHDGNRMVTRVAHVRVDGRSYVVKFAAFETPEETKTFRGAWLKIPKDKVPPLPTGQHYQFELIGLSVQDETGQILGTLEEVLEFPSQHVFVVRQDDRELLIPAIQKVVLEVDVDRKVMMVASLDEWMTRDDAV